MQNTDSYTEPQKFEHLVEARHLSKVYGSGEARVEALSGVDLTVSSGDWVSVIGSSGSGKSTLMGEHKIPGATLLRDTEDGPHFFMLSTRFAG